MHFKFSILLLLSVLIGTTSAQMEKWKFFDKTNGLPTNQIRCVTQDSKGVYWIGTFNAGLVRFDGNTWKVYDTTNSKLPHNYVYSITFDKNQNMWIGTYGGGVAKFDGKNKWTIYNVSNSGLPNNWIYSIAIDKRSVVWIGSYSGLTRFDGTRWKTYSLWKSKLTSKVISIYVDKDNTKWIGTADSIFQITDNGDWKSEKEFGYISQDFSAYWITADREGKILICYKYGSIVNYDGKKFNIYNKDNSKIPLYGFYYICEDQNKIVWCSNFGQGALRFDGKIFQLMNKNNSKLKDDLIFFVNVDSKNNKWFCTYNKGVCIYNEDGVKF